LPDDEAPCRPKNAYGRRKLALEAAIARKGLPAALLRRLFAGFPAAASPPSRKWWRHGSLMPKIAIQLLTRQV